MTIVVFGSINLDLVAATPHLPMAGETLMGDNFFMAAGGKGANQAVAASRLGMVTHLVGRVGSDGFGQTLITHLQAAGVQMEGVLIDPTTHSGVALIAVDHSGQNQIIVVPGANGCIDLTDIDRLQPLLLEAKILLLQLEIPLPMVQQAATLAHRLGVQVILDPAPVFPLPPDWYPLIDILTPNEVEASQLVGFTVHNRETATQAAIELQRRGVAAAIVKLGAQGVVCATAAETFFVPAFSVTAVDTVAAGDAFNGALAAALNLGLSLQEAVVWGAAAGALCATQPGAQSAMPLRQTFDSFLAEKRGCS